MAINKKIVISNLKKVVRQLSVMAADKNNSQRNDWQKLLELSQQMLMEAKQDKFEPAKEKWLELQNKVTALDTSGEIAHEFDASAGQLQNFGFL